MKTQVGTSIIIDRNSLSEIEDEALKKVCANDKRIEVFSEYLPDKLLLNFYDLTAKEFFLMVEHEFNTIRKKLKIGLSEKQIAVVEHIRKLLANNNIGLCHDYRDTGDLCAFNMDKGCFASEKFEYSFDYVEVDDDRLDGELYHIDSNYDGKKIYSFLTDGFAVPENENVEE